MITMHKLPKKSRTFFKVLAEEHPDFKVSKKVTNQLRDLTEDKEISEFEMQLLLKKVFKKGKEKTQRPESWKPLQ